MRTHGTLGKWNDDRGFGFITPAQGSEELFVHVSAFPRDGERPRLNELISFEVEAGADGKMRAVRVQRPGRAAARPRAMPSTRASARRRANGALSLLIVVAISAYGYSRLRDSAKLSVEEEAAIEPEPAASPFHCNGRTMCSQMTSCAEATYFVQHCPGTKMDGNHDGEPCEEQCTRDDW